MSEPDDQPITLSFDDTTDLRSGPELHFDLLSLLPLVGQWQGLGSGWWTGEDGVPVERAFAQRVAFSHDGRPFLAYESRIWLIADDNTAVPGVREFGFWRPDGADDFAVTVTTSDGELGALLGSENEHRWELHGNATVVGGPSSVSEERSQLWALVDEALGYVVEKTVDGERSPVRTAALQRV